MLPFPSLPRDDLPIAVIQPFEHLLDFNSFVTLRNMVTYQKNKPLIKRTDFIKQVTLYLPEVAAHIEESDFGIVHLEVGALQRATKDAIAAHDFASVRRYLSLIADLFDRADAELYDALRISYLEELFLDVSSAAYVEARRMLSRPMENVLRQSELRLEKQRLIQA